MLLRRLDESAEFLKKQTPLRPEIAITLGSGLGSFVEQLEQSISIPYSEIPHFSPPSVEGHPGHLVVGKIADKDVAVLQGRIHYYEGHSPQEVVYPTRTLAKFGAKTLILTNAAGGIDPVMKPGHFMIIDDHINLTGTNPLIGFNEEALGPRFPDMSEPYSKVLSDKLEAVLKQSGASYSRGIYCGVNGPCYETAAEVRYLRNIGGHAVGMSTVLETIAAKHLGMDVCGVSCITNLATGLSDEILSHDDVKKTAKMVEGQFREFLGQFVESL